jgi:hypothetical protein
MSMTRSCSAHPGEHPPTRRPIGGCVCGGGCYHRPAGPGESHDSSLPLLDLPLGSRLQARRPWRGEWGMPTPRASQRRERWLRSQPLGWTGGLSTSPPSYCSPTPRSSPSLSHSSPVCTLERKPCSFSSFPLLLSYPRSSCPPCRHQDRLGRVHVSGTFLICRFSWVKNFEFRTKE